MINLTKNEPHAVLEGCLDDTWKGDTIHNHYESPLHFMNDVLEWEGVFPDGQVPKLLKEGKKLYKKSTSMDFTYDTLYADVARRVKDKLLARGFTTSMLYADVGFTSVKTGVLSKQRVLLGRRDCYFRDSGMTDGKLFHDVYINLSYDGDVTNKTITNNSYALYALTKELSKLIPMRVFVVNHVGTNTPSCYSYVLKKYGMTISPQEFLFFTSASKRTFGFAMYGIMNNGYGNIPKVGSPTNTVSIAEFNLDVEIDNIFNKIKEYNPELFRGV